LNFESPEVATSYSTAELCQVPRYLFYALSLINAVPAPLLWLRYSLFMILYPTGISGEILCILQAMPMIQAANYLDFPLPNVLNFPFNYYQVLYYATALYLPGAPFLFMHMVVRAASRFIVSFFVFVQFSLSLTGRAQEASGWCQAGCQEDELKVDSPTRSFQFMSRFE
jgi:hypothetical protein